MMTGKNDECFFVQKRTKKKKSTNKMKVDSTSIRVTVNRSSCKQGS